MTVNCIVYFGISRIADEWKHYDLTLPVDRAVPLIPGFVSVYLGCYLFWIINYILIAKQGEEHCVRFAAADIMSRLVCCVFFFIAAHNQCEACAVRGRYLGELTAGCI